MAVLREKHRSLLTVEQTETKTEMDNLKKTLMAGIVSSVHLMLKIKHAWYKHWDVSKEVDVTVVFTNFS